MNIVELPLDCIGSIIGRTTLFDACRLAAVCQAFAAAASSELVWKGLLPSDMLRECGGWKSYKEAMKALAGGIYLGEGCRRYLLLRSCGGLCRILSVAGMGVKWGQDERFWRWEESTSSCFGKVAHLVAVSVLHVSGKWSCCLIPGTYSITWRIKVANPLSRQVQFLSWRKPLVFSVLNSSEEKLLEKELDLKSSQMGFERWFEFEVGQIKVEGEDSMIPNQLEFEFLISEADCSFWKGGLYLDCLTLRPSQEISSSSVPYWR